MVSQPRYSTLPNPEELPCSDDTPVDNEDQNLLPNLLLFMLINLWDERMDWYFGVDMAIYHTTGVNPRVPVVPDGFLRWVWNARKEANRGAYVTSRSFVREPTKLNCEGIQVIKKIIDLSHSMV